ncbi:HAD hydrolase-like protein [Patulibacter brassicae]|jgi:2-haloacid dehalogenase/putative hydrolase of the HAD superfamily|uniref:HAD hydrolase-like protein n=1 Tax=Patulibacter brassicae TaxID=1705717 RepID=A0ABU4VNV0_9ACTN|nr:HAD family hydrolase [Patulibacter brassicae]MDX8152538.1 HAD hydrolase-like protein [Patulibacter brassicae]
MPLPKQIDFVTMDVYGTLIDWEAGVLDAFVREAGKDGFTIDRDLTLRLFHQKHDEIAGGSYELYAEVLRRTAREVAEEIGWDDLRQEPSRANFLPDSVERWRPFRETMPQLRKLGKAFQTGIVSNIDDKLLGLTRRHIPHDFDLVVTAQQVRSYKPDAAHFTEIARRYGSKKNWVHIAAGYKSDVEPCLKAKIPVIWINRNGVELEPKAKQPTLEVRTLLDAVRELGLK